MNTVYIHIDERLTARRMRELRSELTQLPHVAFVEYSARSPTTCWSSSSHTTMCP